MKKKLTAILAMLLAAVLLCGAAAPTGKVYKSGAEAAGSTDTAAPADFAADGMCSFDDMPYVRPDLNEFRAIADKLIEGLASGLGYRGTIGLLDDFFALYYDAQTMCTIADIRSCQDLTDEYYAQEYAFCLSALTEIRQLMEEILLACGSSPHAVRLEKEYFGENFLEEYGPEAEATLSEDYVALLEKENELLTQYRAVIAAPTVEYEGGEYALTDALYGAETEEEYDRIISAYYEKYNPILGELYLEMIAVRKGQAEALGYDSYAEMMYDIGWDRDFSVEEGKAFIGNVKKYILPLYERYMDEEHQAELLEDYIPEKKLRRVLESVAGGLGGEIKETWSFLKRYGLYDLSMSDNKASISFETYLNNYEAPYLFIYPYGDLTDVISVTHEFGHCVDNYIDYGGYRSMDLTEVFSQAMQFLSLGELEDAFGKTDIEKLRLLNLFDALDTFAAQTAYAEFEERAYEMDNPSIEALNALSLELDRENGITYDDPEISAMSWIDISHFFEQPFYIISYPVSLCCALEIYESELREPGAGLEQFMKLIYAEEIGVVGAAAEAGMQNPAAEARVQAVAAFLEKQFAA